MQGKNSNSPPPLSQAPRLDDLQKLFKSAQSGAAVSQAIVIPGRNKLILKVQIRKGASGLARSKATEALPNWSLVEGINTLWEYSTTDTELILNLVEETIFSTSESGKALDQAGARPVEQSVATTSSSFEMPYAAQNQEFPDSRAQSLLAQQVSQTAIPQVTALSNGLPLSGNLSELSVCELIQSIGADRLTGRLDITSGLQSVEIYFEQGGPRRTSYTSDSITTVVRNLVGDEVIIEAMTWTSGFFHFNASMQSAEHSPMRRLDLLLSEGTALRNCLQTIENSGLTNDSIPVKVGRPSEAEFEAALGSCSPSDMANQKAIFIACDGKNTLADVVSASGLPKSSWLPIVFNLFRAKLIASNASMTNAKTTGEVTQSPVLKESVKEAYQQMLRADTGLLSYHLFMHFLDVEYQRALKYRQPISLIVITVHKQEADVKEALSSDDLKLVASKIREQLEPFDYVGHYETFQIGILLPYRQSGAARECVTKIINDFNTELAQTGNAVRFVWSFNIGCVPEDGIKLDAVLAKIEKEKATV